MELDPLGDYRGADPDEMSDPVVDRIAGPRGIESVVEDQLEAGDVLVRPVNVVNGDTGRVGEAFR
jgi:hypothetical protein